MRLWAGILAVGSLGVDAASHATFALWPRQVDATLSLSGATDGTTVVKASHGGALATFNMKMDTQSNEPLDPLIDAIEITWVSAADAQSSTFDRFLSNSPRFDRMNAVGIHLQVKLHEEAAWGAINETHHERIESNVREILQNTVPSIEILPSLSKGFLARSLCDFRAWQTSNPLEEILRNPVARSPRISFSSSFPFSSKNNGGSFYTNIIPGAVDSGKSAVERALLETKRRLSTVLSKGHRLTVMKLGRGPVSSSAIESEYLEVWATGSSNTKASWRASFPIGETTIDVLVVASITRELDLDKLEHVWLQRDGKVVASTSLPSVLDVQVSKTSVAASVQADIVGKGFHRRYVMDVELLESAVCGVVAKDKTILVRVPISNTAYIDLDEIRRMERFGGLRLLSFTKHIEIERPSPVSSQHVVGLEFTIPLTNQVHIEFPIHFRYQAPSESELYRQASVIAPDIFLFCRDGDRSSTEKLKSLDHDSLQNYLQTWGLSEQVTSRTGSYWLHLVPVFPLPVLQALTPVGYLPLDWIVSSVTLLFASMGAALLLWVSFDVAKGTQSSSAPNWKRKAN